MDQTRRTFLASAAASAAAGAAIVMTGGCVRKSRVSPTSNGGVVVNDVHAQLSETTVREIARPTSTQELAALLHEPASVCGGRYTSGGQPFLTGERLIDLQQFGRPIRVDRERGLVVAQAGTRWPTLVEYLNDAAPEWAIRQKQSGADQVSLAGTISVNAHGRCLAAPPIVADIEALELVDPDGTMTPCDRTTNADRFFKVIGGYGLFGMIATVTLQLVPRVKLRRVVRHVDASNVVALLDEAAARGAAYGDFHLDIDDSADTFLTRGLMLTYEPADDDEPITRPPADLTQFQQLATFAHVDKPRAWAGYRQSLLDAGPQVDFNDAWQSAEYVPGYHAATDAAVGASVRGSEVLSEFYVPRESLAAFLEQTAGELRAANANMIYGNVRLIEPDTETALPWATKRMACIVMNLHCDHNDAGIAIVRDAFRRVLDRAIALGGTYYLAYHSFARKDQVLACFPQLPELLREADGPCGSDWKNAYDAMLNG